MKQTLYSKFFKRLFDLIVTLIALIVLSPLLLVVSLLVRVKLGTPVIFKQKRPGYDEKLFTIYKFRTMSNERNNCNQLLPDEKRMTKLGLWLRAYSIDELPELWNIIKGDMSFIGPRPQLVRDLVFMTSEQKKRQTVLPGLSGLAQVSGRNLINWEGKLLLDLEYVNSVSFILDLKIGLKTIKKVLTKDGITESGSVTATDFGDYLLESGKISNEEYGIKLKELKKKYQGE